jgi:ascorbate-specific PTS system EIIC-type component UlaA
MPEFLSILNTNLPSVLLTLAVTLGAWILVRTQGREDVDLVRLFRDEAGKESVTRLGVIVSLFVTSLVLIYSVVQGREFALYMFIIYNAVWSGTRVAEKLVDAYAARGK